MHLQRLCALLAIILAAVSLASFPAGAASKRAQREAELERSRELSIVVSGDIDVDAEGKVLRYSLDHRKRLPPPLTRLLDARIPDWRFAPMALPEGVAHSALRMHLRVIANRVGEERDMFRISVRDAGFLLRDEPRPQSDLLRFDRSSRLEAHPHILGNVFLAVRVGPDGKPTETFTERVDLTVEGSEAEMTEWRHTLARFTEAQAKRMRFHVPTTGPDAGLPEWTGRLPIAYVNHFPPQEWEWQVYYPGPETPAPWKTAEDAQNLIATSLLPTDTNQTPAQARLLLTPLDAP